MSSIKKVKKERYLWWHDLSQLEAQLVQPGTQPHPSELFLNLPFYFWENFGSSSSLYQKKLEQMLANRPHHFLSWLRSQFLYQQTCKGMHSIKLSEDELSPWSSWSFQKLRTKHIPKAKRVNKALSSWDSIHHSCGFAKSCNRSISNWCSSSLSHLPHSPCQLQITSPTFQSTSDPTPGDSTLKWIILNNRS